MSLEPNELRLFVKELLKQNEELKEEYNEIVSEDMSEEDLCGLVVIKGEFEDIKCVLESYTDEGYCPWGDEEMMYDIPIIQEACIGNTKSDIQTIVEDYYDFTHRISEFFN